MNTLILHDCEQCGQMRHVPPMDITFCCPEHCSMWQRNHSAEEILDIFEGRHRCQWCDAPLHEKSHGLHCPVLDIDTPDRRYSGFYVSHKTVVKLAKVLSPESQYWGDNRPAGLKKGHSISQRMYDHLAVGIGSQISRYLVTRVRRQPEPVPHVLYDTVAKRWDPDCGSGLLYTLGIHPEDGALLVDFGDDFQKWLCRHKFHVAEGWKIVNEGTQTITKTWEPS